MALVVVHTTRYEAVSQFLHVPDACDYLPILWFIITYTLFTIEFQISPAVISNMVHVICLELFLQPFNRFCSAY